MACKGLQFETCSAVHGLDGTEVKSLHFSLLYILFILVTILKCSFISGGFSHFLWTPTGEKGVHAFLYFRFF